MCVDLLSRHNNLFMSIEFQGCGSNRRYIVLSTVNLMRVFQVLVLYIKRRLHIVTLGVLDYV